MQFVHKNEDGTLGSVLAVLFDRNLGGNTDNEFIQSLDFANATAEGLEITDVKLKTFIDSLPKQFWSYNGSLSTPPCTEDISWTVMSTIQSISDAQVEAFTSKHNSNYRLV